MEVGHRDETAQLYKTYETRRSNVKLQGTYESCPAPEVIFCVRSGPTVA